jgi:hypothetical protein
MYEAVGYWLSRHSPRPEGHLMDTTIHSMHNLGVMGEESETWLEPDAARSMEMH